MAPLVVGPAHAAPAAAADGDKIGNADDIVVTATKVNKETPITASVHTFEPQAIVSRSIIENSVPPTADFSDVILLTPGASGTSNGNGPGLSESKTVLRGFPDGLFNITYDGVPFGDSNDPTHHSTAYFPSGTYERIIVDRGPGSATDLGQASYGGNVHIISRELSDKRGLEAEGVYGTYSTYLGRLTLQSGAIDKLGGLRVIGVGEYKKTDGALTNSGAWFYNMFGKAELPIGSRAKFSILGSYNQDFYHQSDNNGVSCYLGGVGGLSSKPAAGNPYGNDGTNCSAGSQVATYGKQFGLVNVNDPAFAGTPWPNARSDWNWTRKSTDFEIARLQWNVNSAITVDNKVYTYFYKNFTLSTLTSTAPCAAVGGTLVQTATQCSGVQVGKALVDPNGLQNTAAAKTFNGTASVAGIGTLSNGPNLTVNANDIGGYSKLNQYRTSGDILQVNIKNALGLAKIGFWYEHSTSHRYGYAYDLTQAFNAGAFGDGFFNFANMANYFDYAEFKYNPALKEQSGTVVPQYIRYDEYTGWDQYQGFGEFDFKLLDDKLTITPGVKVQNFTRKINTPLASQSARVGISAQDSYKPTLPYLSINYLVKPNLSIYAQAAKGFLVPSLGNSLESITTATGNGITGALLKPTRTTNYQAGLVYAGDRLNIDTDVYYIQATNSTFVDPSTGIATQSGNPVSYMGYEGQVSYVVMKGLTGIVNASLNSAKDDVTHYWLAQAPNYTALAGVIYNSGPLKVSYLHKFTGRQWADTAQTVRINAYSLGTASASYTFAHHVQLGVAVYNVFNDTSTTKIGGSGGARPLYFFNPPRSFQADVKIKF